MERACTRREKKMNLWHFPSGIFRWIRTENYKFGLVQLVVTPASFSVLTTIGFNIVGTNHISKFNFYIRQACRTIIILCTIDNTDALQQYSVWWCSWCIPRGQSYIGDSEWTRGQGLWGHAGRSHVIQHYTNLRSVICHFTFDSAQTKAKTWLAVVHSECAHHKFIHSHKAGSVIYCNHTNIHLILIFV